MKPSARSGSALFDATHWTVGLAILLYGLLTLVTVFFLPYYTWDALAFGGWSRLIERTGRFHVASITSLMYQRPLFYVLQGWMWRWLGHSDALGRALAATFGALAIAVTARTARVLGTGNRSRWAAALSILVLLAVQGYAEGMSSGVSDVPVAALVGAAGLCVFALPLRPATAVWTVLTSALAVLAKPSAIPALAGLAAARTLFGPASRRLRVLWGAGPVALGTGLALLYDLAEARRLRMSLSEFIGGALQGYYAKRSAEARVSTLLRVDWLGSGLRFLLAFAVIGGIAALFRLRPVWRRRAVAAAVVLGALGPVVSGISAASAAESSTSRFVALAPVLATAILAATILAAVWKGETFAAPRTQVLILLVWAGPSFLVWLWMTAYDPRLLSPIWVPLVLLICGSLLPLADDSSDRTLRFSVTAGLMVIALSNLPNVDGLGPTRWRAVGAKIASGRTEDLRVLLMPGFERVRQVLQARMTPTDRIVSSEGRFRYFFPGRATQSYPLDCASLSGQQYFVLLIDDRSASYMRDEVHASPDPETWKACRHPSLVEIAQIDYYVVFRVLNENEGLEQPQGDP